ncbi:MAG: tRNA 5-methoxyuridine(34)/uridine 5-oxyacetic acid(34) synthase CmoB [Pseudomonadota bacterium]|nr:tRNA 5-methoxyuridine(34)/uridine 5-oxyacetic acid(34) synthase CmoB [Pseudomonadota bacterium]
MSRSGDKRQPIHHDSDALLQALRQSGMSAWAEQLPQQLESVLSTTAHGDTQRWQQALQQLPQLQATAVDFNAAAVTVSGEPLPPQQQESLAALLKEFHPWRKGPFLLHGVSIDAEWRSDLKWQRIAAAVTPLNGRTVLDVGCGNGYYGWRMLGEGAKLVVGIDPTRLFLMQFRAIQHFVGSEWPHYMLPMGIEELPPTLLAFDTVFSMGVFYHRRSPIDHLLELKNTLRAGGELVLETLVIRGAAGEVLLPPGRYAKMRNVWFIPSADTLMLWMQRAGFENVRVADISTTTVEEQRSTHWMQFESLRDFLDADDAAKTIEGHPAPVRAVFIATKR